MDDWEGVSPGASQGLVLAGMSPLPSLASLTSGSTRGSTRALDVLRTRSLVKLPALPPIDASRPRRDAYRDSKLMTYRLSRAKKHRLIRILETRDLAERVAASGRGALSAEAPPEALSTRDRTADLNLESLRQRIETTPITPMQPEWVDRIAARIPDHLKTKDASLLHINRMFEEVKKGFKAAMKEALIRSHLPPDAPVQTSQHYIPGTLDFSSPWRRSFFTARQELKTKLHITHHLMGRVWGMGQDAFGSKLLFDLRSCSIGSPITMRDLMEEIVEEMEKTESQLMESWFPTVVSIFADRSQFKLKKLQKKNSFFHAVNTIVSNQLLDLLLRSFQYLDSIFDKTLEHNHVDKLILKMEMILEDNQMQIYPPQEYLEEVLSNLVTQVSNTMQRVPTVESWLNGAEEILINAAPPKDVEELHRNTLKKASQRVYEDPSKCLQSFKDKFDCIINGATEKQIKDFMDEVHSLVEYHGLIDGLKELECEAWSIPPVFRFHLVRLDSSDLKHGLIAAIRNLSQLLVTKLSDDIKTENLKICQKYEDFRNLALNIPGDIEEMMKVIQLIDQFEASGREELRQRTFLNHKKLDELQDVHIFSAEDVKLVCQVLRWPSDIQPLMEQHLEIRLSEAKRFSRMVEEKKERMESGLKNLKEKILGFDDYLEMEMVDLCVKEIRNVQKKLHEAKESISKMNKEEISFHLEETNFEDFEDIHNQLKPYHIICAVVTRWRKFEKRVFDGAFLDLEINIVQDELREIEEEIIKVMVTTLKDDGDDSPKKKICQIIQNDLEEFKQFLPLIRSLRNPNLKKIHWTEMSEAAKVEVTPNLGTTLRKLLKLGLNPMPESIVEILNQAMLEAEVVTVKFEMEQEWDAITFTTCCDENLPVLRLTDDIREKLRIQTEKTQFLLTSPHLGPLEEEMREWHEQLLQAAETVNEWHRMAAVCQLLKTKQKDGDEGENVLLKEILISYKEVLRLVEKDPQVLRATASYHLKVYSLEDFFASCETG